MMESDQTMPTPAQLLLAHPGQLRLQCTSYLLVGPEGLVLIDPGSCVGDEEIIRRLHAEGYAARDVRTVLLTHCHVDHALAAGRWRERGAVLVATPYTAAVLRAGSREVWYEYPDYVFPTEVDREAADGEVLRLAGLEVQALHTPGHTPGCASYLVDTQHGLTAFTGDLLTNEGHPGWAGSVGFSAEQTLASLERLLAAAPVRACWGHGVIEESAVTWIQRGIALGRAGQWVLDPDLHPDAGPEPGMSRRPSPPPPSPL
jgi:glyoxylase-like metal-dependent hydrolase (beta-lactamase superfamily II)